MLWENSLQLFLLGHGFQFALGSSYVSQSFADPHAHHGAEICSYKTGSFIYGLNAGIHIPAPFCLHLGVWERVKFTGRTPSPGTWPSPDVPHDSQPSPRLPGQLRSSLLARRGAAGLPHGPADDGRPGRPGRGRCHVPLSAGAMLAMDSGRRTFGCLM